MAIPNVVARFRRRQCAMISSTSSLEKPACSTSRGVGRFTPGRSQATSTGELDRCASPARPAGVWQARHDSRSSLHHRIQPWRAIPAEIETSAASDAVGDEHAADVVADPKRLGIGFSSSRTSTEGFGELAGARRWRGRSVQTAWLGVRFPRDSISRFDSGESSSSGISSKKAILYPPRVGAGGSCSRENMKLRM